MTTGYVFIEDANIEVPLYWILLDCLLERFSKTVQQYADYRLLNGLTGAQIVDGSNYLLANIETWPSGKLAEKFCLSALYYPEFLGFFFYFLLFCGERLGILTNVI